jgi:hypothetical protein
MRWEIDFPKSSTDLADPPSIGRAGVRSRALALLPARRTFRVHWDGASRIFVSRKGPHIFSTATEVAGMKIEHERAK